jgi:hypothetical protein
VRLAGARRQDHHAAPLGGAPGGERFILIGPRRSLDERAGRQLAVPTGAIFDRMAVARQRPPQRRVAGGRRAEAGRAGIPQAPGRRRRALREPAELEGTASKGQRQ